MKEYFDIYKTIGHVKYLGDDWCLFNTKDLSKYYISKVKRSHVKIKQEGDVVERKVKGKIYIEEVGKITSTKKYVIVKGMENYRFENENFVSLRRLGKVIPFNKIQLERVLIGHAISREKKNDVNKLLI